MYQVNLKKNMPVKKVDFVKIEMGLNGKYNFTFKKVINIYYQVIEMAQKPQASTEILKQLIALEKRMDDLENSLKIFSTEALGKLNDVIVKVSQSGSKRSTGSGTSKNTTGGTPQDKKPPTNSLYWFKHAWRKDREGTMQTYCTKEMVKSLNEHMETNATAKNKVGDARSDEEVKYIWGKYVKPKDCETLRERIKKAFDAFMEDFNKKNMTPANKDGESKGKEPAEDAQDED